MATSYIVNYADARHIGFPVSGAGSNVPIGTHLMKGATRATNFGVLIPTTAASNAEALGVLAEPHNFAASGDATTATVVQWFPQSGFSGGTSLLGIKGTGGPYPSHPVDLFDTAVLVKVDYDLTTTVAWASGSGTSQVITSFEDGYDGGFLYTNAGVAIGQLNFVQTSTGGTITMTAPTVQFTTASKFTKIQPLFLDTIVWTVNTTTAPTLIGGTAAAGTGRAVNLASFISVGGLSSRLDPKLYDNYTGLNKASQLNFYSYLQMVNTALHPIA